jgi:hypothetical protein
MDSRRSRTSEPVVSGIGSLRACAAAWFRSCAWPSGVLAVPEASGLLPVLGGMYLRALPLRDLRRLWRRLAGQTLWTYCHPYDIETEMRGRLRGLGGVASLVLGLNRGATLQRWRLLAAAAAPPLGVRAETLAAAPFLEQGRF